MKVNIQTSGFRARRTLIDLANQHVRKFGVISDRILEAQICLRIDKSETDKDKVCALKIVIPGNDLFASKQSETFEQSIAKACNAIRHQLGKWKRIHGDKPPWRAKSSMLL